MSNMDNTVINLDEPKIGTSIEEINILNPIKIKRINQMNQVK